MTENQKNKDKSYDAENTIVWVATPPYHLANIARQILEYSNNIVVEAPGGGWSSDGYVLYDMISY